MKFVIIFVALFATINAYSDLSAWTEFRAEHSRNYKQVEERLRFQYFQKNLRKIEEHNAKYKKGESTYFLTATQFADWSDEEIQSMFNKQAAQRPKLNSTFDTFRADRNFKAPESVDWREKNAVLEIKNQGSCGSCWTFSTTGTLEGQLAIHQKKRISLSEQEIVDCDIDSKDNGCKGGWPNEALEYVQNHGLASEDDYPYQGQQHKCRSDKKHRVINTLSEIKFVDKNEEAFVEALASIGPISVTLDGSTWSLYGGGVYNNENCGSDLTHAVVGVGYTPDYFIIKNSWGTGWGENGFIRIARGKNICGINNYNCYALL